MSDFVWAKQQLETMNSNLAFILDVEVEKDSSIKFNLTANGSYKFYVDGKLRLYGPARTAKGYCRMDKKSIALKKGKHRVVAVTSAQNVHAFNMVKDTPYFYCNFNLNGKLYTANDFRCYDFSVRVKNAQRYSFQRGFSESFVQAADITAYFENPEAFGVELEKISVAEPKILSRGVPYPHFYTVKSVNPIESGSVFVDEGLPCWQDRSITQVGNLFDGYYRTELAECVTDTVSKFTYSKRTVKNTFGAMEYSVYDLKRNVSGFIGLNLEVLQDAEVYLTFDEILGENGIVDFKRLVCCNVVKWTLKKGKYNLQTIEPYTLEYAQVIVVSGSVAVFEVNVVPVENNDAFKIKFKVKDRTAERILRAAQNTVAQNSPDLLMDCPSRERAGWINDIYYSRRSATEFTGSYQALKNTLENYAVAEPLPELPDKMVPMCYPSDHINGEYIPNCAIWYVIITCEYIAESGDKKFCKQVRPQIKGLLEFFERFENSDGLLEDLESWIFIEWSEANSKEFVRGVNYPSNMMYYKMLTAVNKLWHTEKLTKKCERIKKNIIKQSFNGEFFEDNRVRENGKLKSLNHISEACQYHAFFSGVATKETFPELYKKLYEVFVPERNKQQIYPNIDKANVITGLMMRETMFIENGEVEKALKETEQVYGIMAKTTGTLWELVSSACSCNHGIAAYAGYIIIAALTGFTGFYQDKPEFEDKFVGIDCEFFIPWKNGGVEITVKDGIRSVNVIEKR